MMAVANKIHPTAVIDPRAEIAPSVEIGPYVVVEGPVKIAAGCKIAAHAVLSGRTEIGENNIIGVGAVIGLEPQDLAYKGADSAVKIGNNNNIREYVQIHRGTKEGTTTVVGDNNFFLGFSHVAHNCTVGNGIILANGALLAGYVQVEDGAFVSGHCLVHQFTRIGKYAMMRGGSRISLDLPPYMVADNANEVRGLNTIGLERRGFSVEEIQALRKLYRDLFSNQKPLKEIVAEKLQQNPTPAVEHLLRFIATSKTGICRPA